MTTVAASIQSGNKPPLLTVAMIWHGVVMVASLALAINLYQTDNLRDLGDAVQIFLAFIAAVPAGVAIYGIVELWRGNPSGRYASMCLNYIGMVLSGIYLLHLWGIFTGLDAVGQALYDNSTFLWGFVAAYAVYFVAGRLDEDNPTRAIMNRVALWGGLLCLMVLMLVGGIIDGIFDILGTYGDPEPWIVTATMITFAVIGYRMLQLGDYFGETPDQRNAWQGWLMVSPNIIGFSLFFAGPLLLSFYISFTDSRPGNVPQFVNIENYVDVMSLQFKMQNNLDENPQAVLSRGYLPLETIGFGDQRLVIGAKDYRFWLSLRNTIVFCLMLVPMSAIPALILAVVLNSKIPGMRFFRAIYFLPSVAAVVGVALIWAWLYNANLGYINYAIGQVIGFVNDNLGGNIEDPKTQWLSDPSVILLSVVILASWQLIGFNTVLFLAGLQNIPGTLYEASFVDGASRIQQFFKITIPLLAPTTFFVVVTNVITGLQVFNEPYALITTEPLPDAAQTSVYYLYSRGFRGTFEFGYASAVAWLLFGLIFIATLAQFRMQREGAGYDA